MLSSLTFSSFTGCIAVRKDGARRCAAIALPPSQIPGAPHLLGIFEEGIFHFRRIVPKRK